MKDFETIANLKVNCSKTNNPNIYLDYRLLCSALYCSVNV